MLGTTSTVQAVVGQTICTLPIEAVRCREGRFDHRRLGLRVPSAARGLTTFVQRHGQWLTLLSDNSSKLQQCLRA